MRAVANRLSAAGCALVLPVCALIVWPVVELGMFDEWSYAKTVQVLAQTGRIVYNGWAATMLGWQLYLGALFVKLFGFSFTVVRLSTLPVAMATVFLVHRVLVRCGVNEWNATLGTLALALSPLFFPLTVNFMSDVPGLFSIVLCLYACLRALQAGEDDAALGWICFAAVSNAVGGTVRQIAWLGVLVMVPSTLWLLRRSQRLLAVGTMVYLACIAFIISAMRWFHAQPYSVPVPLIRGTLTLKDPLRGAWVLLASVPEIAFLLLPILLFFLAAVPLRSRRGFILLAACSALAVAYFVLAIHRGENWLAPYFAKGGYVSPYGIMPTFFPSGTPPVVLGFGVRLGLSLMAALCAVCFMAAMLAKTDRQATGPELRYRIDWSKLAVLLGPFTLAYCALLLPLATSAEVYDRYVLPLLLLALIAVLRCYQEKVQTRMPAAALAPIALYAAFAVAGTHDAFAEHRAFLAAIQELRSAGIPVTEIDGGLEYNGWNQIELSRYVNDPKIPVLPGDRFWPSVRKKFGICPPDFLDEFSAIWPRYGFAVRPTDCLGPAGFPPVQYHTWLPPYVNTLYIVKIGRPDQPTRPESPETTVGAP